MKNDPCWKDYKMVGTKKKNGKEVPNCVKEEEEIEEEMGVAGVNTGSIPDTSNMGYKKRDKRRKDDVEHMYKRNLLAKATDILKRLKKRNK